MLNHFVSYIWRTLRFFFLAPIFYCLTSTVVFSDANRQRFEDIFLLDAPVEEKQKLLLQTAPSLLERYCLQLYFSAFSSQHKYHLDIPKFILLQLHSFTGLLDPSLQSTVDDKIAKIYEPLRYSISRDISAFDGDDPAKTIVIFRFAENYEPLLALSEAVFNGVSRPVDVTSPQDISKLYYDVLLRNPEALADKQTRNKIRKGKMSIIAISYRHRKDHQQKLGISKRELQTALHLLHEQAIPANAPNEYCIWWDSCLKCQKSVADQSVSWAAVGVVPYAFCHVLSIRRDGEDREQRLWIDVERALARLSKGMSVVQISSEQTVPHLVSGQCIGYARGGADGPRSVLENALFYLASGDCSASAVTFPDDREQLHRMALKTLVTTSDINVFRGLQAIRLPKIIEVESYAAMEDKLFKSPLLVRLGWEQVYEGSGEEYMDECIEITEKRRAWHDRRNWLPNCVIYDIYCSDESDYGKHINEQVLLYFRNDKEEFGMMLYHEQDSQFCVEAMHGCLVNVQTENGCVYTDSVSRVHIPTESDLLPSFKHLCNIGRHAYGDDYRIGELGNAEEAVRWLWETNEMLGSVEDVLVSKFTVR